MKSFLVVLISFILTSVIVSSGIYYIVNTQATKDKNSLQTQITDLTNNLNRLQLQLKSAKIVSVEDSDINKDIERVNFTNIIKANSSIGDQLLPATYADLNNDNSEEALVVYQYAGMGSIIDFYIYGMKNGSPVQLFKKAGLYGGSAEIKNLVVYADYTDPNSTVNKGKLNSDLQTDSHKKYSWDGIIFIESNQ